MLELQVTSAAGSDLAMTLGDGHPVGSLRVTDLGGGDVRLEVARHHRAPLGCGRFQPPALLIGKVNGRGERSWKSGQNLFPWLS